MLGRLLVPVLAALPAAAQLPGSVDTTPTPPPNAAWPALVDVAPGAGTPGTAFDDPGVGRGMAWVDVVGRDPLEPTNLNKVGPPDGILDFVHANSNSPALPLGAPASQWITPPIGIDHAATAVFRGEPDGHFTLVTHLMGVTATGFDIAYPGGSPWGVLPADYDDDGDTDLFFPCGGFNAESPNALLRNDGGVFVNVSLEAGITESQVSFGAAWLDFDRDGDLDLYVANSIGFPGPYFQSPLGNDPTDRLYRNEGDGTFVDVAPSAGVDLKSTGFSVSTSDLDNDGWTDLVVSCFAQFNKVFYNNGDGTFSFMAPARHPTVQLQLATALVPDPTLQNAFEFASVPSPALLESLPMSGHGSMPVEIADLNGDGWTDVLFGIWSSQLPDANLLGAEGAFYSPGERCYLYLNLGDQDGDGLGDGDFREAGVALGFSHVGGTMGLHAADFDADGYLDLYAGNGGPRVAFQLEEDLYYANDGPSWPRDFPTNPLQELPRTLYEIGALTGSYANTFMAHGMISTRSEVDGRVELVVANGGPAVFDEGQTNVFFANTGRSDGRPFRTVAFDLVPDLSPPEGLGTRVELLRGARDGEVRLGVLERRNSIGFACASSGPLVFGLGESAPLYARTSWTSGVRQGTFLLPAGPGRLAVREPRLSLDVRRLDTALQVTLENRGAQAAAGDLVLEVVRHASLAGPLGFAGSATGPKTSAGGSALRGWVAGPREVRARGMSLAPGASWSTSLALPAGTAPGLHRFLLVDRATDTPLAENAAWVEEPPPFAQRTALPATPWTGAERASVAAPSAARPVVFVQRSLELAAGAVEATRYHGGTRRQLALGEQRSLPGASLEWAGERVRLQLDESAPASVAFQDGDLVLTLGAPLACCDSGDAIEDWIVLVRFSDVRDGLLLDGVRYTARGERTSSAQSSRPSPGNTRETFPRR